MAIYHLSIKVISRGKGKSAVAAAAYRAGEKIRNEYDGIEHDYTRKGGIAYSEIMLPQNAPPKYKDRAVLWNAVEKIEKAKNSQLAREIEIALPKELNYMQTLNLVKEYVYHNFIEQGMCADICIHDKKDGNPHAHIMLTMRPFNEDRSWGDKQKKVYHLDEQGNKIYDPVKRQYACNKIQTTDWNEQTKAEEWRAAWTKTANRYLEHTGQAERIDHRSYERQGIEQIPTIHLGAAASQMEKRGIRTERGDINRNIAVTNSQLRQLKSRIIKLQSWLFEEMQKTEPPTLADMIDSIINRHNQTGQQSRFSAINNLKAGADLLNFITANDIKDMAGLDDYFKGMISRQVTIRDKLKPIERRLKTLEEHLQNCENFKKYGGLKAQYDKLNAEYKTLKNARGFGAGRKAQKALDTANEYYETHRMEITLYQAAEGYLKAHLNGRDKIPLPAWKAERERLIAEKGLLNRDYQQLKADTDAVSKIRSCVYDIVSAERRREQPNRARDMNR